MTPGFYDSVGRVGTRFVPEQSPRMNLNGGTIVIDRPETDPTVPEWAKQPDKPKYTADEIQGLSTYEMVEISNQEILEMFKK